VRKTVIVLAAASLLLTAACADEHEGASALTTTTSTTSPDRSSTTTTTSPEEPEEPGDPGDPGDPGGGGEPGGGGGSPEDCTTNPPVWAFVPTEGARPAQDPQTPEECDEPEPELGTGDVQITLRWDSSADLDLHVTEPDGTKIWYQDKGPTSTGGRLDVDSNIGCDEEVSVENVFWPTGQMPLGHYTVEVNGFTVEDCGSGRYTVTALVEGEEVLNETGEVGEDETDTYEFEA
jgi:hypothetical protein